MKLVEILTSLVVHRHIFHLELGFDERAQCSPSSVVVIEERAEDDASSTAFGMVNP